jgi:hypothetical protein
MATLVTTARGIPVATAALIRAAAPVLEIMGTEMGMGTGTGIPGIMVIPTGTRTEIPVKNRE